MRLGRIEKEFGADVKLTWKSYLLRPRPEPKSLEKFARYTKSWRGPAAQADGGRFREWATDESPPTHSIPPNVALKAARRLTDRDGFERFHLALMDAYFYANRNVTADVTILDVAVECGFDRDGFERLLLDDGVRQEVVDDHNEALELGITGVPTLVVDGLWPIPGAQDLTFYRHVVNKRLALARDERA